VTVGNDVINGVHGCARACEVGRRGFPPAWVVLPETPRFAARSPTRPTFPMDRLLFVAGAPGFVSLRPC